MRNDRYRLTSIARPIDPTYPTNRAVIGLVPAIALVVGSVAWIRGAGLVGAGLSALEGGLIAALSWALAREIAPDHDYAAFLSMGLSVGELLLLRESSVLALLTALMLSRIVNRSTGLAARDTDLLAATGVAVLAGYLFAEPWIAVVAAAAFMLDSRLSPLSVRAFRWTAVSIGGAVAILALTNRPVMEVPPPALRAAAIVIAVLFAIAIPATRHVMSVGDATAVPLVSRRVRAAMAVVLLLAVRSLFDGAQALLSMAGLWMTMAGVAVWILARPLVPKRRDQRIRAST